MSIISKMIDANKARQLVKKSKQENKKDAELWWEKVKKDVERDIIFAAKRGGRSVTYQGDSHSSMAYIANESRYYYRAVAKRELKKSGYKVSYVPSEYLYMSKFIIKW
jgi:hypothetical protein